MVVTTLVDERVDEAWTGKLAARVARQIERDIVATRWQVGHVVGSETELRERYQVSRAVLREAIRLVEHHQVGTMRRGPNGGLVVRAPDAGATASAMVMYLKSVGTTLEDLISVRIMLEPLAVTLAAEQITESGIAELRAVLEDEARSGMGRDAHLRNQLHLTLAKLSGNPALHLFIDVLLRLTWRYAGQQLLHLPAPTDPGLVEANHAHRSIADAVVAGQGARAQYHVQQHLEATRDYLRNWQPPEHSALQQAKDVLGTPVREQKLAEVVAERLLTEIIERGWEVGSVIGSEAMLLERFDVSRPALREAVRLLEYHSVAQMRRGPGGGLIVTKPNPTASIDATALHLDYQGLNTGDLHTVREVLELGCTDQLVTTTDQDLLAHRLPAFAQSPAPETGTGSCHPWHIELADLSGNPALALFLRILITLRTRHHDPVDPAAGATDAATAHQGIVDALLTGDAGLARHRMRRHLHRPEDTGAHGYRGPRE
ncbi:FadR/GntR family transcriptional regulator [Pseudonocardia acaciae]|uniref:FadR/GntR family transcriptional regulator n=1 Tax=Pseudonocardia acaciae TaxID=551276 RepID=UPI000A02C15E|nr:FCD domain-containing protein [Pseudonocardia acaciae]